MCRVDPRRSTMFPGGGSFTRPGSPPGFAIAIT
jgi:hypothetical protein